MTDDQTPPTAPGFRSLPLAPEPVGRAAPPAPLRGAWSLRRKAATAIAVLALVGTGGAVAAGSLADHEGGAGADDVTPPAAPAHPGATTPDHSATNHESGDDEESDEA